MSASRPQSPTGASVRSALAKLDKIRENLFVNHKKLLSPILRFDFDPKLILRFS